MQTFFEIKALYIKVDDDGREVKVAESFIFDAVSFTDAETRATAELARNIRGEFQIDKISKSRIVEVFAHETGEYWWMKSEALSGYWMNFDDKMNVIFEP
jgi:hypothetical protein